MNLKPGEAPTAGEGDLVQLDKDHPGFRDPVYRARRNDIARAALAWRSGLPVPRIEYTEAEHGVWAFALDSLRPLHERYACEEFLDLWPSLHFDRARIPAFDAVNERLERLSGFSMIPVAGLISPKTFMADLARDAFLATQYIRHHSTPLYTPEPDVIHELVGHASLLAHPRFARVNRLFGEATLRADEARVQALIRVYWYTLEFGVVKGPRGLQVIGAGLLSSFGELGRFETQARLRPFDLEEIARTPFDPTSYQGTLFVGESTERVLGALEEWLSATP